MAEELVAGKIDLTQGVDQKFEGETGIEQGSEKHIAADAGKAINVGRDLLGVGRNHGWLAENDACL